MNRSKRTQNQRPGAIAALAAVTLVAMVGFLAFAVDIGLIAMAKTQAQAAADLAAMTGARSLDSSQTGNSGTAVTNAQNAGAQNFVLGKQLVTSEVVITNGALHWDTTQQAFYPQFPAVSPDKVGLTQAVVTPVRTTMGFSNIVGIATYNCQASAIACQRPRDISLVLDYSGSMNNEADLWVVESDYGSNNYNTSNNMDPNYPQFGPYDTTFSSSAKLLGTNTDARVGRCNVSASALGIQAQVGDYYQNAAGSATGTLAFYAAPSAVTNTTPGGDTYLPTSNISTQTALTWLQITDGTSATTPSKAFTGYNAHPSYANASPVKTFKGYTQGPGYWGMTFFIWPPDPNTPNDASSPVVPGDWRKRFFFLSDGVTPLNDNSKLFNSSGTLNDPTGNYVINYKAILKWISTSCTQASAGDGKPFPPKLRAGRTLYYSAIPADVPPAAYTWSNANSQITNQDQRFWKEYIDYTLGVYVANNGAVQHPPSSTCAMGGMFTAGSTAVQITGPDALVQGKTWINPKDNPQRPRHQFWFGPMTLINYLQDAGYLPGTASDISMVTCKNGIQGSLTDIQNNHPNDLVGLMMFSRPQIQGETGQASFVLPAVPLTNDFTALKNGLWYPPSSTSSTDVGCYDPVYSLGSPRAHGDYTGNTATGYGLRMAYNQYSGASYYTSGSTKYGGLGRQGAQKLLVMETDGMANVSITCGFTQSVASNGQNNSYYKIAPSDTITGGSVSGGTDATNIATTLCSQTSASPPGFASGGKPVLLHVIAFGAVFEPVSSNVSPNQAPAFSLCQQLSSIGGTGFPSSLTNTSDPNYYKICIGDQATRQAKTKQAVLNIMDSDYPIALVK